MRCTVVAVLSASLFLPALAHGSPGRADVEGTTFAWGGAGDAAAFPGAQLALSLWFDRLGLVIEGSRQMVQDGGAMSAYGLGARFEIGELPTAHSDTELSVWTELGAGRERWRFQGP